MNYEGPGGYAPVLQAIADSEARIRADIERYEARTQIRIFNSGALRDESIIEPIPLNGGIIPDAFPRTIVALRSLSHDDCTNFLNQYNLPRLLGQALDIRIRSLATHIGVRF